MSMTELTWVGTESQQHRARIKACRERCAQYGQCAEGDGSCTECEYDMQDALRVRTERPAHGATQ